MPAKPQVIRNIILIPSDRDKQEEWFQRVCDRIERAIVEREKKYGISDKLAAWWLTRYGDFIVRWRKRRGEI